MGIPKQHKSKENKRIFPNNVVERKREETIRFSFEAIERNEYFNLDATCVNWASDLFEVLKCVSQYKISDIYAGNYTKSTIRIHDHKGAPKPPCELPRNVSLDDMWQIRISKSKGGIHGKFVENVFYVIWFDPLHNLYPDDRYGGIKKIKPPNTCCKDRDDEVEILKMEIENLKKELDDLLK